LIRYRQAKIEGGGGNYNNHFFARSAVPRQALFRSGRWDRLIDDDPAVVFDVMYPPRSNSFTKPTINVIIVHSHATFIATADSEIKMYIFK
jgi:hypothetical protein